MSEKYTYDHIKNSLRSNGFLLLSKKYYRVKEKLHVQCLICSYKYHTRFDIIASGSKCPNCVGTRRLTGREIKSLISKRNGILLSKWENSHVKIKIKCLKCDHIWDTYLSSIRSGSWCSNCHFNSIRNSLQYVQDHIKTKNGSLLSTSYKNNSQKLEILCNDCDNTFKMTFSNIVGGKWCALCKNKTQKYLFSLLKEIFNMPVEYNYKGFEWLRTNGKYIQEIDIWVPDLKLAIEYDGEQHFIPVCFGGISKKEAKENLKDTKRLDKIKNKKIKERPEDIQYFIRFNYKEARKLNKEYVMERLKIGGVVL